MGIRSFAADLLPSALQLGSRSPSVPQGAVARPVDVASFAELTDKLGYLGKADIKKVREAYKFADEAHLGQFRASGEPYITHPIAVAGLCADWRLDAQAIMAALMHDAMEDCGITKPELIERFGPTTALKSAIVSLAPGSVGRNGSRRCPRRAGRTIVVAANSWKKAVHCVSGCWMRRSRASRCSSASRG